jgi:hypothetical protein
MVGVARSGQRSYDNKATGGQLSQPIAHQMAKLPLHRGANDGPTYSFTDNETRTRRGSTLPSHVRVH